MIKDTMIELFGQYAPIDGKADWTYIGGVILFAIVLLMALYALCGVIKRR